MFTAHMDKVGQLHTLEDLGDDGIHLCGTYPEDGRVWDSPDGDSGPQKE